MASIARSNFYRYCHLGLPFLFLIAVGWELALAVQLPKRETMFLAHTLFFGASHAAITYVYLAWHPNFQRWIQARYQSNSAFFGQILLLGGVFYALLYFPRSSALTGDIIGSVAATVFIAWSTYHIVMQVNGVLNQYGVEGRYDAVAARKQKKLLLLFIWIFVFARIVTFVEVGLPKAFVETVRWGQLPVLLVILALVMREVRRVPENRPREQLIFLFRLVMFPLACFSVAAICATSAIHGMESLYVNSRMLKNTSGQPLRLKLLLGSVGVVLVITGLQTLGLLQDRGVLAPGKVDWSRFSAAFVASVVYLHYYLEGKLYRMQNPASRLELAPLLRS